MKPEYALTLRTGQDEAGRLKDWVSFEGPAAMLIPVLEEVLVNLRNAVVTAGPWPPVQQVVLCLAHGGPDGPCVLAQGHPPERAPYQTTPVVIHQDIAGNKWVNTL